MISGCRKSEPTRYYLNTALIQQSLRLQSSFPAAGVVSTAYPGSIPAKSYRIAGAPESPGESGAQQASQKVRKLLDEARAKTYQDLILQFTRLYQDEADALRQKKIAAFDPVKKKLYDDALARISVQYQTYAVSRGPMLAKLSAISGFPDPDPKSLQKPTGSLQTAPKLLAEASQLRASLATLDENFHDFFTQQIKIAKAQQESQYAALIKEIDAEIGDINARAQLIAKEEEQKTQSEIAPLIAEAPTQNLPAVPSRSLTVPGTSVTPDRVAPIALSSLNSMDRAKIRNWENLWAQVHGYALTSNTHDQDGTAQFLSWMSNFHQMGSQ